MPRQNHQVEERVGGGQCKIRKRRCSSSSSSSLAQKYRFKRAILVGKQGGSSTPVPTWKTISRSPSSVMQKNAENFPKFPPPSRGGGKGNEAPVSARKLAATLWEINDVPSPLKKDKKEMKCRERIQRSSRLSDPSHSPISEIMDRTKGGCHRRRTSAVSEQLLLADYKLGRLDSLSNAALVEIETQSGGRNSSGCMVGMKTRLKDVSNGLTTSKELLKVLNRVWGLEEQHSSSISLVSALRQQLDQARIQVDQLIREQRSNRNDMNYLMKQFAEEKAAWKSKERDRIHDALASMAGEIEVEKKLRRQTERLNKKLGKELADMKVSLSKATKELECEKRAREILEQVCDELARGIGEDRAEVEELKRESAKAWQEVEKEREMLQVADVLREERVQMKLSEAKYHFEEKNAAVEKLKNELEGFLSTKLGKDEDEDSPKSERSEELRNYLRKTLFRSCQNGEKEEDQEEDSAESDLHSIELNMDNNSKSYEWRYAGGAAAQDDDSRRVSVEEFKGRKSISEKIQWESISLNKKTSDDIELELDAKSKETLDSFDKERLSNVSSQSQRKDYEDEINGYKSAKDLRDHLLSSKITSVKSFASPTWQWGKSSPSSSGEVQESSMVLQGNTLKARLARTRGERHTSMQLRQ